MHLNLSPATERGTPRHGSRTRVVVAACLFAVTALSVRGGGPVWRPNLTELSLEELMQIEVTTVSKRRERLTDAPAAVFVLNAEDMDRAGVANLPDALRLVPGLQVGQMGSHEWAISARGFTDVFSNKLLVLQDGRSVYTPLFSGVFWETQDAIFDDIERVEVVRGPGATLWGANAVNGVINVLSKPASETQGSLGAVTIGSDPQFSASARYGGAVDRETHFRVYGKYTRHNDQPAVGGGRAADDWRFGQTGFRVDRNDGNGNVLTLQGDAFRGRQGQVYLLPGSLPPFVIPSFSETTFDGANLLGRATHRFAGASELMVQGYFDYTGRQTALLGETRRTFDLEVQHRFAVANQEITIGGGYRSTGDSMRNTSYLTITPARDTLQLASVFLQDDIALAKTLHVIVGSKLEHNDYTGREIQPGARLLWTASEQHTFWASAARAVRTPARSEEDVFIYETTSFPGVAIIYNGNRSFRSEVLTAYEAGWRFHAREKFSIDLSAFVNRYRNLRTSELTLPSLFALAQLANPNPAAPPRFPITLVGKSANAMHGETYGAELAVATQPAAHWRVRAAYSHLRLALHREPTSTDLFAEDDEGRSPRSQGYIWSQHDLSSAWKLDWVVRSVGRLRVGVPAYVGVDLRVAYRPANAWELSIAGRNLNDPKHPEFLPAAIISARAETARSVRLEIKHEF